MTARRYPPLPIDHYPLLLPLSSPWLHLALPINLPVPACLPVHTQVAEELRLSLLPEQELDAEGNPVYRDENGNIDPLCRPLTDRSTDADAPPPPVGLE